MRGVVEGAGVEERKASRQQGLLARVMPKRAPQRMLGNEGGDSSKPSEGRGLSLARLACCTLLPSVALAGVASAAAAAGAGGAAAALSPLLTNRWWVASVEMCLILGRMSSTCSLYSYICASFEFVPSDTRTTCISITKPQQHWRASWGDILR